MFRRNEVIWKIEIKIFIYLNELKRKKVSKIINILETKYNFDNINILNRL